MENQKRSEHDKLKNKNKSMEEKLKDLILKYNKFPEADLILLENDEKRST